MAAPSAAEAAADGAGGRHWWAAAGTAGGDPGQGQAQGAAGGAVGVVRLHDGGGRPACRGAELPHGGGVLPGHGRGSGPEGGAPQEGVLPAGEAGTGGQDSGARLT